MRRVIHAEGHLDADSIAELQRAYVATRADAIRAAVRGTYRHVLATHPGLNPVTLYVDLTGGPGGAVRWVVHDGHHVPSVLSAPFTRRYGLTDWLQHREGGD
ncbi:hypothetical protein SCMU_14320 [Sinomonas cyclohexanicum]|uniref:Uncharacterized protein n=1 Tax=Sinomonas cyclohexanicum TaxID=322009 RepID=A0ABM7PTL8_SINCY|nr:hypothetical protein [Corynebacterium cyclohexanicum]BCT75590.1 hypothetical protein SCMU_14320 [Corynebacterium cyclohexanicum]